jgi:LemA protein
LKRGTIVTLAVVAGLLVIGLGIYGFVQGTYNDLVRKDEAVKAAWAQVETSLQRRLDLIPNLGETVRGYQIHEEEVLTQITEARARAAQGGPIGEQIEANRELSSALSRLLVVVENYPQLRATENFARLQDELAGTENRISVARVRYNETVQDYNVRSRQFPASLIAGIFGFERAELFEAAPGAETAPKVDFRS